MLIEKVNYMDFYLILFMLLSTVVVIFFISKKIWYNNTYYKTQYVAIVSRMNDFKKSFENVRSDKREKQVEYKRNDILTDLVSFKIIVENMAYKNKNQKVYLSKLTQLLYIDFISFVLCFDKQYSNQDLKKLYKEKKFKALKEKIDLDFVDPIIAQYEVYSEVKEEKNTINKNIVLLMQNIERKIIKQKEKIENTFKKN